MRKRWTASIIRCATFVLTITVPIPEVFYWNTSVGLIGAPFALMAFVEGKPLGTSWMLEYSDRQRLDMLSQIAGYMAQLRNLSFDKIGMLDFEEDGELRSVREEILIYSRMFRPWENDCRAPSASHTPGSTVVQVPMKWKHRRRTPDRKPHGQYSE